jgi:hypothetical protein
VVVREEEKMEVGKVKVVVVVKEEARDIVTANTATQSLCSSNAGRTTNCTTNSDISAPRILTCPRD